MHGNAKDLTGQRFGRLLAKDIAGRQGSMMMWHCVCDCGNTHVARAGHLLAGRIRSCGCLAREEIGNRARTHGRTHTTEYKSWYQMRARCKYPSHIEYHRYGARGIKVCEQWESFERFFADMGPKPTPRHSIDRINNGGNYEPSNCRWADPFTQGANKRNNIRLTQDGVSLTLSQWERALGLRRGKLQQRIARGWSAERALSAP